jgi:SAM-dependent methyltransferase
VVAELLAPHARSITCVDTSERVVAAARKRLSGVRNVDVREGDMHALALADRSFDLVLMMHALPYAARPPQAMAEAARVLRPGGRLLAVTLARHQHRAAVAAFDHKNLGFTVSELKQLAQRAGLAVQSCTLATRERRPPHFEVLSCSRGSHEHAALEGAGARRGAARPAPPPHPGARRRHGHDAAGHRLDEAGYRGERFADEAHAHAPRRRLRPQGQQRPALAEPARARPRRASAPTSTPART